MSLHLGHIALFDQRWQDAIGHFDIVLQSKSRDLVVPYHVFESLCGSAIAFIRLHDYVEGKNRAEEARKLINGSNESQVDSILHMIPNSEDTIHKGEKNIRIYTKDGVRACTFSEAQDLIGQEEIFTLNLLPNRNNLSGPLDTVVLSELEARLLKELLISNSPLTGEMLYFYMFNDHAKPLIKNTLKSYVSRLRSKIRRCVPDTNSVDQYILSTGDGMYQWSSSLPYQVIEAIFE